VILVIDDAGLGFRNAARPDLWPFLKDGCLCQQLKLNAAPSVASSPMPGRSKTAKRRWRVMWIA